MFSTFDRTLAPQTGDSTELKMSDNNASFSGPWGGPLYGVLQHL